MAVFDGSLEQLQRLDFRILQSGWSCLYRQLHTLNSHLEWFDEYGFEVIEFDCAKWVDETSAHEEFKVRLDFPNYYGMNLNALNDCLSEIEINDNGMVVVFRHFDHVDKILAHHLLDIFADNSRLHMLFGKKLLVLAQADSPDYSIDVVGACPVIQWD